MRRPGKRIIYILQEIGIVVIGVLIAVSINNYKERIDNEKFIRKTMFAIENEIKLSQAEVDTIRNRHVRILDYFVENIEDMDQSLANELGELGGIQSPSVKTISLRFFIANKAELVDFDVIAQLSEIETHKDALAEKMDRLIDFASENVTATDTETKMKFAYYLANVIDSEDSLLALFAEFLENKDSYLSSAAN